MMRSRTRSLLTLTGVIAACVALLPATSVGREAPAPVAGVTAGLTPDSISGVRGQLATVALGADMGTTGYLLGSYAVTITWDSAIVRLDSVRSGSYGAPVVNYVNGGELRLTQVNTSGVGGAMSLALLYFRFMDDEGGLRTPIQTTFTEMNATDFTSLLPQLTVKSGVARIVAPAVLVTFSPDSLWERVGFKPRIDLVADLRQATDVALGSYTATLTWDPAIMVFDSIRAGDYAMPEFNQVSAGELRLTAASAQGVSAGPFSLAALYFSFVNASYPSTTALALSVSEMSAALTFANLLPGVSAKNGKAFIGGVLRGDIDVSGAVAALDAQLILQSVVGLPASGTIAVPNGDADCSATLTAKDAQIVLNYVVENDVSAFCAGKIQ